MLVHSRFWFLCSLFSVFLPASLFMPASRVHGDDPAQPVSFMNQIAPILKENCFACHDAKKRKGKLDMSTFERLMKGGDKGEPIVAGKPEESLLWTLTSGTEEPRMPPKESGEALAKPKAALIERWIREGAKFDGPGAQADLLVELRKRWTPPAPPISYKYPSIVRALAFTPDNKKLIVGGYHELLVWDIAAGKLEKRIHTRAERTNAIVLLPSSTTGNVTTRSVSEGILAVAGGRPGQEGDVRLYNLDVPPTVLEGDVKVYNGVDPKAGVLVRELVQADDELLCLALSVDGKKLAAGGCDRLVRVWDIGMDFKLEQTIENHADWVFGVSFAPDNKHLLTCSRDKTAKVWDLSTKESVLTFADHQTGVFAVAVRPDGKLGVSGGEDNQLRFWNPTGDGKQIRIAKGHGKTIWKAVYHPTKPLVVSASADMTVRIWNPDNGQQVRSLSGHTDWVYALSLSPDGALIASGAWNGEVRVWKLDDGTLVKAFSASPGLQVAGGK